jgi:hypothetical protein
MTSCVLALESLLCGATSLTMMKPCDCCSSLKAPMLPLEFLCIRFASSTQRAYAARTAFHRVAWCRIHRKRPYGRIPWVHEPGKKFL